MGLWGKAALLGGIPLLVMGGIAALLYAEQEYSDARSTLAVGVIVAAAMAASQLYEVEQWSLARQSVLHFLAMLATVLPALILSGWFPTETVVDHALIVGIFLGVGLCLWLIGYVVFGRIVPRLQRPDRG